MRLLFILIIATLSSCSITHRIPDPEVYSECEWHKEEFVHVARSSAIGLKKRVLTCLKNDIKQTHLVALTYETGAYIHIPKKYIPGLIDALEHAISLNEEKVKVDDPTAYFYVVDNRKDDLSLITTYGHGRWESIIYFDWGVTSKQYQLSTKYLESLRDILVSVEKESEELM